MAYIVNATTASNIVAYDGLDPLTGKERRRWHPAGHDRHEAEQMAERVERDNAGPAPARGRPTQLGEFLTDTWLPIKRRHVRSSTAYRYSWFVDRYINPTIGPVPLRRLRADHLDGLDDQLAPTDGGNGDGLAPKTVHEVHMIVRASLDLARRRQLVDTNVAQATNARHKRQTRKVPRSWTAGELVSFLAAARSHRLYPALHLTATAGCAEVKSPAQVVRPRPREQPPVDQPHLAEHRRAARRVPVKTRTSRRCIDLDHETMKVAPPLLPWVADRRVS